MTHPLDRAALTILVDNFYDDARRDPLLGPVFADTIADDAWDAHKARLVAFWSTALLGTREFRGNVFIKHVDMPGLAPQHFGRWLALFEARVTTMFAPRDAQSLMLTAQGLARGMQVGLFGDKARVRPHHRERT